jgi:hypothetical protein
MRHAIFKTPCVAFHPPVKTRGFSRSHLFSIDYWRLNEAGLIQEMTVLWRPLPAVVAVQKKLALAEGEPTQELVH